MKKLTLDLNELRIESFEPAPALWNQRGTVQARSDDWDGSKDEKCYQIPNATQDRSCMYGTCGNSCNTCYFSCGGTCYGTCYADSCLCWTSPPYC